MMKTNKNETIIVTGIDHGYGNMKTATRCFPSGVVRYEKEPIFQNNLLVYNGMYYQIGEEHKEFCAEKTQDDDYYVLTLAAIAKELEGKGEACDFEQIRQDIQERDERDMTREIAPLKQAEDAALIDSSEMGIDDVVKAIIALTK